MYFVYLIAIKNQTQQKINESKMLLEPLNTFNIDFIL